MKSNKIFFSISIFFFLTVVVFTSCDEEDKSYQEGNSIHFATDSTFVSEGDDVNYVPLRILFLKTSPISGSATITISGGTEGVDYNLSPGTNLSLSFGPNDYQDTIWIKPIDNGVLNEDKVITLTLSSSDVNVGFAGPDALNSTHGFVITDNDCAEPLTGTYDITSGAGCLGAGGGACGQDIDPFPWNGSYPISMSLLACEEDGKYLVSDITMGLYPNGWGDSPNPNPGVIVVSGTTISIIEAESPDVIYGSDAFFGDGTVNSDGSVVINFSNSYGDMGSVTLSPQ